MAKTKKVSPRKAGLTVGSKTKVDYCRNEVNTRLPQWFLIRDAIMGDVAVKGIVGSYSPLAAAYGGGGLPNCSTQIIAARAMRYLPKPNPTDTSKENNARYASYVLRATYYNVTGRTLEGLTGQIFLREPDVTLPTDLSILTDDATGSGISLDQFANVCVRHCIAYGRTGILVDYPVTLTAVTKAQQESGEIRPTFTAYDPWNIINWRFEQRGAKRVLTMVVLREVMDDFADDGFAITANEQYRVLELLDDGTHQATVYRKASGDTFDAEETSIPLDVTGKPLSEIPFHFVGSENNDFPPNKPPLYDLANINIAHYRNSADYEESCYMVGQPTPVISGVDESWVQVVLKNVITLGTRAAIPLPIGAKAELLQAQPNSMPMEAMKEKEAQMVALGAKLVQVQKTQKTATEKIIEETSESSPLANISKNVSHAIVWAINTANKFVSKAVFETKYQLNKDFDLTSMTADDQNAVIAGWMDGALASSEMRTVLRRAGVATLDDDAWKAERANDIEAGIIADPTALPETAPGAAPASGAGGPQPKRPRRQSAPSGAR